MDYIVVGARPADDPAIVEDGQKAVGYVYASARRAFKTARRFRSLGWIVGIRTSDGVILSFDELRRHVRQESE